MTGPDNVALSRASLTMHTKGTLAMAAAEVTSGAIPIRTEASRRSVSSRARPRGRDPLDRHVGRHIRASRSIPERGGWKAARLLPRAPGSLASHVGHDGGRRVAA